MKQSKEKSFVDYSSLFYFKWTNVHSNFSHAWFTFIYSYIIPKFTFSLSRQQYILPFPYFCFVLCSLYNNNWRQSTFTQIYKSKLYQCRHNFLFLFYVIILHIVAQLNDICWLDNLFSIKCQKLHQLHVPGNYCDYRLLFYHGIYFLRS